MDAGDVAAKRSHRPRQAGSKYDKKKRKDEKKRGQEDKSRRKNHKAFGVAKVGRANKAMQRKLDLGHRKDHAPVVERKPEVAPPMVVVVMGPPGSGKSTLIKVSSDDRFHAAGCGCAALMAPRKLAPSLTGRRLSPGWPPYAQHAVPPHPHPAAYRTVPLAAPAPPLTAAACPSCPISLQFLQSLVKKYTRHNLTDVRGPITVVTSKQRRVTFFEAPNDLCAMLDLAKVADLVMLTIDGSFGFEMETFEFLNILQVSGFPRVMGVLTHLDGFRDGKTLQRRKREMKQRFWGEIHAGAKLFYLSGLVHGSYQKNETHNLALYVSRMKVRPLQWRSAHPYVLVDRVEDVTDPAAVEADATADRRIALFGFVRGLHLKAVSACGSAAASAVTGPVARFT